jgi:hypothetical protein
MPNLQTMLREHDEGIFPALATVWNVNISNMKTEEMIRALHDTMLEEINAETVWGKLNEAEKQAVQTLIGSKLKMPSAMFKRLYGEIHKMGRGQIEREQPHKNPQTISEGLYYRGIISEIFEQGKAGMIPMIYIPDELAQVLPLHKTAYEGLEAESFAVQAMVIEQLMAVEDEYLENVKPADTSIVDDMCTLLAFLRNYTAGVLEDDFLPADAERIKAFLLNNDDTRLNFLLGLGVSADLITTKDGRAYPKRSGIQKWLEQTRSQQLKTLVYAWQSTTIYRDLWHVSGLYPDPDAAFPYDASLGREALMEHMKQLVPPHDWWAVDELIDAIKLLDPDFQRPGGDYESWYIRNEMSEYLNGFESWEAIEGLLLDHYIRKPMHWLGLVDMSEDAAKLTAYGRAYIGLIDWPEPPEASDIMEVRDDGVLVVSRKVSRIDRFQVARFSTWGTPENAEYYYRIDAEGLAIAEQQAITTGHIATFLTRHLNNRPMPARIAQLLDNWQGSGSVTEVTFERLLVLRTNSPEVLDRIYDEPALRRYLGARLGSMAVVIRAGQEEDLQIALGDTGIKVEII